MVKEPRLTTQNIEKKGSMKKRKMRKNKSSKPTMKERSAADYKRVKASLSTKARPITSRTTNK
jgi:hypothetical protein